jgi:Ca2+-binding EF-hand superfamily protein
MRTLPLLAAASALALGGAGIALAQYSGGERGGFGIEQADADGDGVITLDEAKAQGAARFAKMDANQDGTISQADRKARAEARFAETDTNKDGEISPEEMTAAREQRQTKRAERGAQRQAKMFETLDTDGSGGLSKAELEAGKQMRGQRGGERKGKRMGRRGGRDGAQKRDMRMLKRADTNGDEAVSREEFDAMVEARFARIDTDGSGTITQAERDAAKAKRGGRRGPRGQGRGEGQSAGS